MPLKKQNVSFPILKGLQQNVHKWLVPEGQLCEGYNLEFDKDGAARTRDGFKNICTVDIDGNAPSDNLERLAVRGDELVCIGKDRVYSYSPTTSRFADRDDPPTCIVGEIPVTTESDSSSPVLMPCSAVISGILGTAWKVWDSTNGRYAIDTEFVDIASGAVVYRERLTHASDPYDFPKLIAINDAVGDNDYFVLVANKTISGNNYLVGRYIIPTAAGFATGWSSEPILQGSPNYPTAGVYDIAPGRSSGGIYGFWLVTYAAAGTAGLYYYFFRYDLDSGTPIATHSAASTDVYRAISCSGVATSSTFIVGFIDDTGAHIHIQKWTEAAGTIGSGIAASWDTGFNDAEDRGVSVHIASSGYYWIAWCGRVSGVPSAVATTSYTSYRKYDTSLGLQGSERTMYNIFLADQLFDYDGWVYHVAYEYDEWAGETWGVGAADTGITNPFWDGTTGFADDTRFSFILVGLRDDASHTAATAKPHAMALSKVGTAINRRAPGLENQFFSAGPAQYGNVFYSAQRYLTENTRGKSTYSGLKGITNLTYDFSDQTRVGHCFVGNLLVVGGGNVSIYDGRRVAEVQFCWLPRVMWAGYNASVATGLKSTGTLDYVFTYEVYTRDGRRIQSAPSVVWSVDRATYTDDEVQFNVVRPTLTNWCDEDEYTLSQPYIAMYRRETSTGPFYFAKRKVVPFNDGNESKLMDIVDSGAEGAYDANEQLYTLPGGANSPLENLPIPGGHILASHDGRVFVVSGEDPTKVYYSNQLLDGRGVEFTLLYVQFAEPITGLASMDNVLVAFAKKDTFVVPGRGPSATGLPADGFGQIQTVSGTVGCIDHRSIVQTPMGVFFQSSQGFMLLDRGLSISPIGDGIEDELEDYPYVLRGVLYEAKSQVAFLVTSNDPPVAGTTGFRRLVYDYDSQKWSYDIFGFEENTATHATLDMAVLGDRLYLTERTALLRQYHTPIESSGTPTKGDAIGPGTPTTYSFKGYLETAWLKMGNLQDFKRVWRVRVLGETGEIAVNGVDPHAVKVHLFKDYNETAYSTDTWAVADLWAEAVAGRLTRGGPEQFEVHNPKQKCQSLKVGVEIYNCTYGFGVRIVGVDFEVGLKRGGFKNLAAAMRS